MGECPGSGVTPQFLDCVHLCLARDKLNKISAELSPRRKGREEMAVVPASAAGVGGAGRQGAGRLRCVFILILMQGLSFGDRRAVWTSRARFKHAG